MATPFSNRSTQKPYNVLLAGFFLLLTINLISAQSISFNFPNFTPEEKNITLQGDAKIWEHIVALPGDPSINLTTSRALYAKPVPIWDKTTGNVASFVTSFSFIVTNFQDYNPADGLVFFLAPWGTEIPKHSGGGNLGIVDSGTADNKFVAVEFDTHINVHDPSYRHIGIDVNSLNSLKTVEWNRVSGSLEKVRIIYDSLIKTLTVVVTHPNGEISTLSQIIDLKAVLPETVSIGFSTTTTNGGRERHDLYSWSFTSSLNTINTAATENINIAS